MEKCKSKDRLISLIWSPSGMEQENVRVNKDREIQVFETIYQFNSSKEYDEWVDSTTEWTGFSRNKEIREHYSDAAGEFNFDKFYNWGMNAIKKAVDAGCETVEEFTDFVLDPKNAPEMDMRVEIVQPLLNVQNLKEERAIAADIATDLYKEYPIEELRKIWFVNYGTVNGWSNLTNAKYAVACALHKIDKEEHPELHKDESYSNNRGWSEDKCSCGLCQSCDSSD